MCSFLLFVGDFRDLSAKFAIAIYPREGTKTSDTRYSRSVMTNCNLSPRGDENARVLTGAGCTEYCNLSPRGDENISGFTPIGSLLNCNLSPQGDGNLYRVILMYRLCIAIYPRKGTETDSHFSPHISSLLQFIPARGRETTGSAHSEFCIQLQFIPARGRKRLVLHCPLECAQIAIYPREGTKTRPRR